VVRCILALKQQCSIGSHGAASSGRAETTAISTLAPDNGQQAMDHTEHPKNVVMPKDSRDQ
jgi:hypothetical protein